MYILTAQERCPLCIKNWITTLRGFWRLWKILDMDVLETKNINQDALEIFLGLLEHMAEEMLTRHQVRSYRPSRHSFTTSPQAMLHPMQIVKMTQGRKIW